MARRRKQVQPHSGLKKAFGQAMRNARNDRHVSQMKLHIATGLDRTFISDLERGIQLPSLETIVRVAAGLEMKASALVKQTEESHYFVLPSDDH